MTQNNRNPVDHAKLRKELETIAEYLQAGGSLEEILAQIRGVAEEQPPETPPGEGSEENGAGGEESPPETPPETPPEEDPPAEE